MPSQRWAAGGEEQRRGRYVVTDIDVTFSTRGDAGSQPAIQAASPPWSSHVRRAPLLHCHASLAREKLMEPRLSFSHMTTMKELSAVAAAGGLF